MLIFFFLAAGVAYLLSEYVSDTARNIWIGLLLVFVVFAWASHRDD